jgi:hypothetical protein
MQTKIKTKTYAARLRAKLKELQEKRPAELASYKKALDAWRKDLKKWIADNAEQRVDKIKIDKTERYFGDRIRFNTSSFFVGAPVPPVYPSDKQIRDIRNLLRHLGITGQETITVSTEDVARYLGEGEEDNG